MDTQAYRIWLTETLCHPIDSAEVGKSVMALCNEVDTLKRKLADEIEAGVRQFAWDAKCLRKLASVFGISVPESDEAIVYAADRVLSQTARDASELFGKTEQLRSRISEMETEIRNLRTSLTQAQIGDCCKAPDYCDGECTCEICDPQGNIEYWKAYAGEAEKENDELKAELESAQNIAVKYSQAEIHLSAQLRQITAEWSELFGKTERLKSALSDKETELRTAADEIDELAAQLEAERDVADRQMERIRELEGEAYSNGELYNKEYLKREEAERRCGELTTMLREEEQRCERLIAAQTLEGSSAGH